MPSANKFSCAESRLNSPFLVPGNLTIKYQTRHNMYDLRNIPTCFILCGYFSYILLTLYVLPVSRRDQNYEATKLHFENLVKRYGNPIIILNLIKVRVLIWMVIHALFLLLFEIKYNLKCSDAWTWTYFSSLLSCL